MVTKKSFGVVFFGIALAVGLSLSSCATNVASVKSTSLDSKTMDVIGAPYNVLGPVQLEKSWFGVLGISIPAAKFLGGEFPGFETYFYQQGGITYVDLLAEAQKTYADADAVIDINFDYSAFEYWYFFARRNNIASGIAIKYTRDLVTYPESR